MPVPKRWTKFTRENIEKLSNRPGAYEISNPAKQIIYIGGSDARTGVKGRLISHLIHNRFPNARYFRCDFRGDWDLSTGRHKERVHAERYAEKRLRKIKPPQSKRLPRRRD